MLSPFSVVLLSPVYYILGPFHIKGTIGGHRVSYRGVVLGLLMINI